MIFNRAWDCRRRAVYLQLTIQAYGSAHGRRRSAPALPVLWLADAVQALLERYGGLKERGALVRVAGGLGLSKQYIGKLCQISTLPQAIKKRVESGKVDGRIATIAHRIGGTEFVNVSQAYELSRPVVQKIASEIGRIKDPTIRDKVKQSAAKGHVKSPTDVQKKALQYAKPRPDGDLGIDIDQRRERSSAPAAGRFGGCRG